MNTAVQLSLFYPPKIEIYMKEALKPILTQVAEQYGYHYLSSGVRKTKAGKKTKKLLLSDNFGNEYDIDGVIADESMRPLILFESKYIRYKKHNRDKGSWVCTAHSGVRRRYHSIRSSIAILAGNWSKSSIAMMESHDINIFLIPFDHICDVLSGYGIDFNWGEKEKEKARQAWERYNELTEVEQAQIGGAIAALIESKLVTLVQSILDDTIVREIARVVVELISNLGEVKVYEFDSVDEAIHFLNDDSLESRFVIGDSLTLFDPPAVYD